MEKALDALVPNKVLSKKAMGMMIVGQVIITLLIWLAAPALFFPKPQEIWAAFTELWMRGLGQHLVISFLLNLQAVLWSTVISLLLSYLTLLPFFRPLVSIIGKMRFLSLVGLSFFFQQATKNGHELKLSLLVFSISVFFITGMVDVIASAPKESFDLARTLRMGEWRASLEVVVLGQADKAFDTLRQNAAMGWMMLTMVESLFREGGGVGTWLTDSNRYFRLDAVFAIQITILLLGMLQDYALGWLKNQVCPYANLTLERK